MKYTVYYKTSLDEYRQIRYGRSNDKLTWQQVNRNYPNLITEENKIRKQKRIEHL